MNALAHTLTAAWAGGSRSQERVPRSRILWDWLHRARSNLASQSDDGVARSKRPVLQVNRLRGDLEQLGRMVGISRLRMAAK